MLMLKLATHPEGLDALIRSGWMHAELAQWMARSNPPPPPSDFSEPTPFEHGGKAEAYTLGVDATLADEAADDDDALATRVHPSTAIDRMGLVLHSVAHVAGASGSAVDGSADSTDGGTPTTTRAGGISAVPLPPHLLGALGRTKKGQTVLGSSGVVDGHLALLGIPGTPAVSVRGALWCVGHVGASASGFEWLLDREPQTVAELDRLARKAPVLSVRGTPQAGDLQQDAQSG